MAGKLNRWAYEKLIQEDRDWLAKQPRTLEREHIDLILKLSPDREYPPAPEARPCPGIRLKRRWESHDDIAHCLGCPGCAPAPSATDDELLHLASLVVWQSRDEGILPDTFRAFAKAVEDARAAAVNARLAAAPAVGRPAEDRQDRLSKDDRMWVEHARTIANRAKSPEEWEWVHGNWPTYTKLLQLLDEHCPRPVAPTEE